MASAQTGSARAIPAISPWMVALVGFAVMYVPAYWTAAQSVWQTDEMAHGPIVLAVVLWACWQLRHRIAATSSTPAPVAGWLLFGLGLVLFGLARVFSVLSIEFASQVLVVAGSVLLLRGPDALRAAWFPVLYMLFLVPMPASLVDAATGPLKHWISVIVVDLLYAVGYPIARAGVTISIGPYQLLVADACSGLNSMFGLAAIGAVFMFVMGRKSRVHNAIMLAAILPIAFIANVIRVACLVIVTYEFGDEAGQGFLHGAAGLLLFLLALAMLLLLDACVAAVLRGRRPSQGRPPAASPGLPG